MLIVMLLSRRKTQQHQDIAAPQEQPSAIGVPATDAATSDGTSASGTYRTSDSVDTLAQLAALESQLADPLPTVLEGRRRPPSRPRSALSKVARRLAAPVGLMCIAAVAFTSPAVRHQLAVSFTRVASPYTELYFSDYSQLTQRLMSNRPNYIRFSVTNHEGRKMAYSYVVSAWSHRGTRVIDRARVVVSAGQTATRSAAFRPRERGSRYRISVDLSAPRPERISFTATS